MIRAFFKDSYIYIFPSLLSRGIGLLLLPVYTRYLTPEDYGIVEILAVVFAILNLTVPLEITQAVARLLPRAKIAQKHRYTSTSFWFTGMGFALVSGAIFLFPEESAYLILGDAGYQKVVVVGAFAMIANALFYVVQNQLRWCFQPKAYALSSIIFSGFTAAISVTLVAYFQLGVLGVIFGQLMGSCIALAVSLFLVEKDSAIRLAFDVPVLSEMLQFSAPLVLSGVAVYFTLYTDRIILREFLTIEDVGIYSVAYRIASVSSLAILAFQMPLTPLVYKNYDKPETKKQIGDIFSYFLILIIPLLIAIALFSGEILKVISAPAFWEAATLAPWLTIGIVMMSLYVFSPGLGIAKKTKHIALINIIAAAVNVIMNLLLVPLYGRSGAAAATVCCGGVMAALYFWLGNLQYRVEYRTVRNIGAALLLATSMVIANFWQPDVLEKMLIWLLLSSTAFFLLFTKTDWVLIKSYLHEMR